MNPTVQELVAALTLEEKAGLCSGADFWHTKAVARLGIPAIKVSDGPHGLRTQREGSTDPNDSIEAVCFPAGCAAAASFDPALTRRMGAALGREARANGVQILLGPAVNIKRSPLCGRNFEYYSEDPYLAGELAAGFINGVQSEGVGTSIKHFAANDQETRRLSVNSRVDERTLQEIYLPAFETAVKKARPWTVMCSYNRLNGAYASENKPLLTDILRGAWGFDGFVMSDWGAVNDRVKGIAAGLELEMPGSQGVNDRRLIDAVRSGTLDEAVLDTPLLEWVVDVLPDWHDFWSAWEAAAASKDEAAIAGRPERCAAAQPWRTAAAPRAKGRLHRRLCRPAALSGRRLKPCEHDRRQRAGRRAAA